MSLFSKLKDYNLELEEILEQKYFSSNIKNLLLSMIYKLEISYPDFKEVKRCVRGKEDFLNEIIEIIRLYCDNVKTVEPDSSQAKMLIKHKVRALTNEKERSVLTYPTEIAMLYAISDISPKYFYIDQDFVLKNELQLALVNGYNQNNLEILKDFSGWSWDRTYDEKFEYADNLIYQNLLAILGEKFLYEWRTYGSTRRDFLEEAQNYIKIFTGNENYMNALYKYIYITAKDKEKLDLEFKNKLKILKKMDDKIKFLEDAKTKRMKLNKKVEKIDIALHDSKILEKSLIRYNSKLEEKKRIKSLKKYRTMIENERIKNIKEINEISLLLKPSNFLAYKQELQNAINIYKSNQSFEEILIEFQKEFLKVLYKRLCKMKTRDEIIDVIYELRYYRKLKFSEEQYIDDIEELEEEIDKVLKKAITQLCKLGAMKIVSMDINLNFEIIKYALDTKIINLEQIRLSFSEDSEGLIIKIYDKEVFEKQGRKKINLDKKTLEIKKGRKIKLFN